MPQHTKIPGGTPYVLRALDAPDLPLEVTGAALDHVLKDKHRHEMTVEMVEAAIDQLYDPAMVFKSKTEPNALVAVTEVTDRRGNPVVVAVHLEKRSGRLLVNRVSSAYGKEGSRKEFGAWAKAGLLRYYSKQKALAPTTTVRLDLPYVVQLAEGFGSNLITDDDVVRPFGSLHPLPDPGIEVLPRHRARLPRPRGLGESESGGPHQALLPPVCASAHA